MTAQPSCCCARPSASTDARTPDQRFRRSPVTWTTRGAPPTDGPTAGRDGATNVDICEVRREATTAGVRSLWPGAHGVDGGDRHQAISGRRRLESPQHALAGAGANLAV